MLTEERHSMIIKAVNERASVTIAELSEILNVSASTVKRDLIILANEGKIIKVRGGAMSKNDSFSSVEKNVEEKSAICTEEKNSIAGYAAKLIEKGDFVFLDAGTTTEKMIDHLTVRDVTFVTNGFIHAKKLAVKGYKVFITGGEIKASTEAIVGAECVLTLKNYNFTKCFMGTNGISLTAAAHNACIHRTVSDYQNVLSLFYLRIDYLVKKFTRSAEQLLKCFRPAYRACILLRVEKQ